MSTEEQNDEYLWSKTGAPDPEVARLEDLLGRYRDGSEPIRRSSPRRFFLAAAAVIAVALGAWWFAAGRASTSGYAVRGLAGTSAIDVGDEVAFANDGAVDLGELGEVRVAAGSRLGVLERGDELHRLFLERGRISASIFAKPRLFQIGTPAGLSIDLGCEYDLAVDDAGMTTLSVRTGRVAFESEGRKVLVPRGATCRAVPGRGPDTPIFEDAEPDFVAALRAVEFAAVPDEAAVARVCELTRREDSLSLFHLLDAPSRTLRARAFERLSELYPRPTDVTSDGVLAGDESMRASWREDIELDWR
jgi:hypothetical protein